MKREDWQRAYQPLPDTLETRVYSTLAKLEEEKRPASRLSLRTAVILVAALLALGGVAYAMIQSKTADIFGWFYGGEMKEELLAGDIAPSGQSHRLGDIVYTLDEVIYRGGTVYGTGTMRAAEGANIVLMAEDYFVDEPAGYLLHYGGETIPEDAPSYAELAEERNAKIILAMCRPNGILNEDDSLNASEIGYSLMPQHDGSIRFYFQFAGGAVEDGRMTEQSIDRAQIYRLSLLVLSWEVTRDGEWLRDDADVDTRLRDEWVVTVTPTMKGE